MRSPPEPRSGGDYFMGFPPEILSQNSVQGEFELMLTIGPYGVRPVSGVRPSGVRDFGDFCEGYKRLTRGHIRLDNFSEICPRFILVTLTNRD